MSGDAGTTGGDARGTVIAGERWRPARASAVAAALLAVGYAVWVGHGVGLTAAVAVAVVAAGLAAVAVVLSAGDRRRTDLAASLLAVPATWGVVGAVGAGAAVRPLQEVTLPVYPDGGFLLFPTGVVVAALAFGAAFGAALGVGGRFGPAATRPAAWLVANVAAPVAAAATVAWVDLAVSLPELAGDLWGGLLEWVAALSRPTEPGVDVFLGLVVALAVALFAALSVDPLRRFDDERLEGYQRFRSRAAGPLAIGGFVGGVLDGVLLLLASADELAPLLADLPAPVGSLLVTLSTVVALRVALVLAVEALLAVTVGTVLVRRLARIDRTRVLDRGARLSGGLLAVVGVAAATAIVDLSDELGATLAANRQLDTTLREVAPGLLRQALGPEGDAVLVAIALAALTGVLLAGLWALVGLHLSFAFGLVPSRAGGFAVAAACSFGLAAVVGVVDGATLALAGGVALSLVVWDLGEFAVGLGEEVGRVAPTTHGELVHAGAAFGLGGLAVGATALGARATGHAAVDGLGGSAVVALFASLAGLALLLSAARS